MIVDFHTHTFPDKIAVSAVNKLKSFSHTVPYNDGMESQLLSSMKEAGVNVSVVVPVATSPKQVRHINDSAIELNRQQGWFNDSVAEEAGRAAADRMAEEAGQAAAGSMAEKTGWAAENAVSGLIIDKENGCHLLSFGCMHPLYEDWEAELERIAQAGIAGVKIHPPYQNMDLDDPRFLRIIKKADQLGLVTITHTGIDIGLPGAMNCTPQMARNVYDKLGPVKLVLAHMGGWKMWDDVKKLLADTTFMLDTSFSTGRLNPLDDHYSEEYLQMLDNDEFMEMVELFGADRLLFGTDNPWGGQKDSLAWMRQAPLTDQQRKLILGENAKRILSVLR